MGSAHKYGHNTKKIKKPINGNRSNERSILGEKNFLVLISSKSKYGIIIKIAKKALNFVERAKPKKIDDINTYRLLDLEIPNHRKRSIKL
jgi:hypothetical protein